MAHSGKRFKTENRRCQPNPVPIHESIKVFSGCLSESCQAANPSAGNTCRTVPLWQYNPMSRDKIDVMPLQNKTLAIKPANMDAENYCIRDGVVVVTKGTVIPNGTSI